MLNSSFAWYNKHSFFAAGQRNLKPGPDVWGCLSPPIGKRTGILWHDPNYDCQLFNPLLQLRLLGAAWCADVGNRLWLHTAKSVVGWFLQIGVFLKEQSGWVHIFFFLISSRSATLIPVSLPCKSLQELFCIVFCFIAAPWNNICSNHQNAQIITHPIHLKQYHITINSPGLPTKNLVSCSLLRVLRVF